MGQNCTKLSIIIDASIHYLFRLILSDIDETGVRINYIDLHSQGRKIYAKMEIATKKNINIFLVGLAFFFSFTAFQTMGNIQTVILQSANCETGDPDT